jgi:uncharacterized membrane protein
MPTESAAAALKILRDGSQFQWYVIPLMLVVVYVYAVEIEARKWNVVFAGLAFWAMDWFNEIWNGLVFHFTNYAPVWAAPGRTAYLILIGLNIEIAFMFAIMGIVCAKLLPADRSIRILGVPNRWFLAVAGSIVAVVIEHILNAAGALTWDYWWWNRGVASAPIVIVGYLTFFVVAFWVHDMASVRSKIIAVTALWTFDFACFALFAGALRWI